MRRLISRLLVCGTVIGCLVCNLSAQAPISQPATSSGWISSTTLNLIATIAIALAALYSAVLNLNNNRASIFQSLRSAFQTNRVDLPSYSTSDHDTLLREIQTGISDPAYKTFG